jgi:hypothetical protein
MAEPRIPPSPHIVPPGMAPVPPSTPPPPAPKQGTWQHIATTVIHIWHTITAPLAQLLETALNALRHKPHHFTQISQRPLSQQQPEQPPETPPTAPLERPPSLTRSISSEGSLERPISEGSPGPQLTEDVSQQPQPAATFPEQTRLSMQFEARHPVTVEAAEEMHEFTKGDFQHATNTTKDLLHYLCFDIIGLNRETEQGVVGNVLEGLVLQLPRIARTLEYFGLGNWASSIQMEAYFQSIVNPVQHGIKAFLVGHTPKENTTAKTVSDQLSWVQSTILLKVADLVDYLIYTLFSDTVQGPKKAALDAEYNFLTEANVRDALTPNERETYVPKHLRELMKDHLARIIAPIDGRTLFNKTLDTLTREVKSLDANSKLSKEEKEEQIIAQREEVSQKVLRLLAEDGTAFTFVRRLFQPKELFPEMNDLLETNLARVDRKGKINAGFTTLIDEVIQQKLEIYLPQQDIQGYLPTIFVGITQWLNDQRLPPDTKPATIQASPGPIPLAQAKLNLVIAVQAYLQFLVANLPYGASGIVGTFVNSYLQPKQVDQILSNIINLFSNKEANELLLLKVMNGVLDGMLEAPAKAAPQSSADFARKQPQVGLTDEEVNVALNEIVFGSQQTSTEKTDTGAGVGTPITQMPRAGSDLFLDADMGEPSPPLTLPDTPTTPAEEIVPTTRQVAEGAIPSEPPEAPPSPTAWRWWPFG